MQGVTVRRVLALGSALLALSIASGARAEGEPCFNDTDCPNAACGGDVCNWNKLSLQPTNDKPYYCQAAGLAVKGMDGWCTTDENCKCRAQGAKCVAVYCSFTSTFDAPSRGGSGPVGSGMGGSSSGGSHSGGSSTTSTGGSRAPGTGNAPSTPGSSGSRSTNEEPTDVTDYDPGAARTSSACSVSTAASNGSVTALFLAVGVALASVGRRKPRPRTA